MWTLTSRLAFVLVLIIEGILIFSARAGNTADEVVVSTDKVEYRQGEIIVIVFTNNLNESVFSHIQSLTPVFCIKHIEKKIGEGVWDKLYAQCRFPNCTYEIDPPGEIEPGESVKMEWKPLEFVDGTAKSALLAPGVYRLAISYEKRKRKKWRSVYTNTFVISSGRKK